ncbi:MAG: flagellar protein [Deltaproteobacteria bacterium]|nr:flagellar protein [Deltaproteobacteria bacterium]
MIHRVGQVGNAPPRELQRIEGLPGFGDQLDALLRPPPTRAADVDPQGVSFSKHAQARLASRGIELDECDMADLNKAVDNLARKGARESLVLLGENAFIVGVPDRKVVTALSRQEAIGNIFTNIDSTVVAR